MLNHRVGEAVARAIRLHLLLTRIHPSGLFTLAPTQSIAGDVTILSIGPRYGFSRNEPVLGKRQTESFELIDIAATFKLPWTSTLGNSAWSVKTRTITSAGRFSLQGPRDSSRHSYLTSS